MTDPVETPPSRWSTRKLCIAYDALRRKYYLDGFSKRPPPSSELRVSWLLAENSPDLAVTTFDDDDEPESLQVNLVCRTVPSLMRRILLHELSHMRLGKDVKCSTDYPTSAAWRAETVRLAALGAPLL